MAWSSASLKRPMSLIVAFSGSCAAANSRRTLALSARYSETNCSTVNPLEARKTA
jgi:hypothetical protein